ncbi:Ring finger domain family protein [Acanthocheilonema viteae]
MVLTLRKLASGSLYRAWQHIGFSNMVVPKFPDMDSVNLVVSQLFIMVGESTNSSAPGASGCSDAKRIFVCCAICKESISQDDISALRCGHLFHFMCIMYFFIYGWTSCPECYQPSEMADIVSLLYFDDTSNNTSDTAKKLANYRDILRKLHKAYLDNLALEKREMESAVEKLILKKENYELKKKYLELMRENKALKHLLMMKP